MSKSWTAPWACPCAVIFVMALATSRYLAHLHLSCWSLRTGRIWAYLQTIVFILDHRGPGAAAGEHPEEVHPRAVQGAGCVSAPDHHQLHHPGRDHF
ncbi:MAG: hypothetical protein ACLTR8_03535 [Oscillospiraceae bacterium]